MKALCLLIFLVLSPAAFAGQVHAAGCPGKSAPLSTVPPKFPAMLHNEYSGKAEIAFTIAPSGGVVRPVIASLQLHPVGHSGKTPRGYREALLAAVSQWRYPPRAHACHKQVTIVVEQAADGA